MGNFGFKWCTLKFMLVALLSKYYFWFKTFRLDALVLLRDDKRRKAKFLPGATEKSLQSHMKLIMLSTINTILIFPYNLCHNSVLLANGFCVGIDTYVMATTLALTSWDWTWSMWQLPLERSSRLASSRSHQRWVLIRNNGVSMAAVSTCSEDGEGGRSTSNRVDGCHSQLVCSTSGEARHCVRRTTDCHILENWLRCNAILQSVCCDTVTLVERWLPLESDCFLIHNGCSQILNWSCQMLYFINKGNWLQDRKANIYIYIYIYII